MVLSKSLICSILGLVVVSFTLTGSEQALLSDDSKAEADSGVHVVFERPTQSPCTSLVLSVSEQQLARGSAQGLVDYNPIKNVVHYNAVGQKIGNKSIVTLSFNSPAQLSVFNQDGTLQRFNVRSEFFSPIKTHGIKNLPDTGIAHAAFLPNKNEVVVVVHQGGKSNLKLINLDKNPPEALFEKQFDCLVSALVVDRHDDRGIRSFVSGSESKIDSTELDGWGNISQQAKEYCNQALGVPIALDKRNQLVAYASNTSAGVVNFSKNLPELLYRLNGPGTAVSFSRFGMLAIATLNNVQLLKEKRGVFEVVKTIDHSGVQQLSLGKKNLALADSTTVQVLSLDSRKKQKNSRGYGTSGSLIRFHDPCWKRWLARLCSCVCCCCNRR